MPETAPVRRQRRMIQTRVEEVRRLTPHLIRVVVGGDDLERFGAGEFTDHYVKLQLPPPGATSSEPDDDPTAGGVEDGPAHPTPPEAPGCPSRAGTAASR